MRKNRLGRNVRTLISTNLLGEHFRGHILRATTVRVSDFVFIDIRLGQPKVSYLYPSLVIKKNVFELDISEQNVVFM